MFGLWHRTRHERAGFTLYASAVAAARDPYLYTTLGVADTLDGRFDLIGLYVCLLIRRLRQLPAPGQDLAQAVFDAMFSDMDVNLREMGVGDLSVGKRVRAMWEAFHGRAAAYDSAIAAGGEALQTALIRNIWRGAKAGRPADLARLALAEARHLDEQGLAAFVLGEVSFVPAQEAAS